jgi:hypothetical protein
MVAAAVQFKQNSTTGPSGQAMLGTAGTVVQVQNGASNVGVVSWTYNVVSVPYNSAVPLGTAQSGSTPTWTFTPDVTGCFVVQLVAADASTPANTASDQRAFGVLTASGHLAPSFTGDQNSLNFAGQLTGWDVYMEQWLAALELLLGTSVAALNVDTNIVTTNTAYQSVVQKLVRVRTDLATAPTVLAPVAGSLALGTFFGVRDTGVDAAAHPITVTAPAGWKIQNPGTLALSATAGSIQLSISGAGQFWFADPSQNALFCLY